jgi:3-oxoacyl-[acyl-carrier protein] reductase
VTRLDGKVALVTGASGAIGRAISIKLASLGARIAVHYGSNVKGADETARLVAAAGSEARTFKANIADTAEIRAMFTRIDDAFGRLDILVNNAGVGNQKKIIDITEEDYEKTFAVNAKGYLFCMQEAGIRMGEGGRIVNISSVLAQLSDPGTALYAATRAAVRVFARVAAQEFGPKGITVNSVSPGPVEPGMFQDASDGAKQRARALSPFNRVGSPEDVADIIAFLVSDQARWITGQDIVAAGGAVS